MANFTKNAYAIPTKYTEGVNYPKGRSPKAVTSHVHYYMPPYKCQRVINSYAKLWGPGTP